LKVLDIGCDNRKIKGAIGIDIDPDSDADIIADAHDIRRYFHPKTIDVVHAHQVIEHCEKPFVVLVGIHYVLKDDGVLWLSIPNIRKLMRLFFYLRGKQINQTKGHIYAWDEDTLRQLVSRCGFKWLGSWFVDDNHKPRSRLFANRFLVKLGKQL